MLSDFMKNFKPENLSDIDMAQQVRAVTPIICSLADEEQIMYWEFIASKITKEQQHILTNTVKDLLVSEKNKDNYAEGILLFSFDVSEFNESLKKLQAIKNPDEDIKSAIKTMENLQKELLKSSKKPKM